MKTRLLIAALAAVLAVSTASGCGDDSNASANADVAPAEVPNEVVPPALKSGEYSTRIDDQAKEAFTKLDEKALVADGRLWQIRQVSDDRLIGTLQISTVAARVDLLEQSQRDAIVNHILPGSKQEIEVGGLDVWASESNDKLVYVWFAKDLFQVLQLKGTNIDPEAIVQEIVAHQTASPAWKPLPQPAEDEEVILEEEEA